ncbi:hypothetical protein [Escherichia phage pEC-M2929-1AR.1]|nr:hypothetical protein [Escherichia phage pEC-M2929-1AR.1]
MKLARTTRLLYPAQSVIIWLIVRESNSSRNAL